MKRADGGRASLTSTRFGSHTDHHHDASQPVPGPAAEPAESTMLALMGHMSRAMLERYSHIRLTAKRDAVAGVLLRPKTG